MIKKIYIFNENKENRIIRTYESTLSNKDIQDLVLKEKEKNVIETTDTIVFRKYNYIYIAFVVENENEMYVLGLISLLMDILNLLFKNVSELHFIYHFKDVYDILDRFIVGGIVIETNVDIILGREISKLKQ